MKPINVQYAWTVRYRKGIESRDKLWRVSYTFQNGLWLDHFTSDNTTHFYHAQKRITKQKFLEAIKKS